MHEGLNRALSAKAGQFTGHNEFGLFLAKFTTECPFSGERRRVWYFYRQVNGKPPADPVSPLDITDELSKSNSLQSDCMQLGRGGGDGEGGGRGGGGGGDGTTKDSDRTPKRARKANNTNDDSAPTPTLVITPGRAVDDDDTATADVGATGLPLFWDSPEAAKLFGFSFQNGNNVNKGLTDIVQLLSHAQQSHDGHRRFVANVDHAPLTPTQIFHLRSQCLYLRTAYQIALEKLGQNNNTWIGTCCGEAIKMLSYLGFNSSVDKLRIGLWNQLF
jgi:hypothetical protein